MAAGVPQLGVADDEAAAAEGAPGPGASADSLFSPSATMPADATPMQRWHSDCGTPESSRSARLNWMQLRRAFVSGAAERRQQADSSTEQLGHLVSQWDELQTSILHQSVRHGSRKLLRMNSPGSEYSEHRPFSSPMDSVPRSGSCASSEPEYDDPESLPEALAQLLDLRQKLGTMRHTLAEAGDLGLLLRDEVARTKEGLAERDLRLAELEEEVQLQDEVKEHLERERDTAARDLRQERARCRELQAQLSHLSDTEQANDGLREELEAALQRCRTAERESEDLRSLGWCMKETRRQLRENQAKESLLEQQEKALEQQRAQVSERADAVADAEGLVQRLTSAERAAAALRKDVMRWRFWGMTQSAMRMDEESRAAAELRERTEWQRRADEESLRRRRELERQLADARAAAEAESSRLEAEVLSQRETIRMNHASYQREAAQLGGRVAEMEAALAESEAQAAAARAALDAVRQERAELRRELSQRASISAEQLEQSEAEARQMRAGLSAARAEADRLRHFAGEVERLLPLAERNEFLESALRLRRKEAEEAQEMLRRLQPPPRPAPAPRPKQPALPATQWCVATAAASCRQHGSPAAPT
eukprot:TRINITY_DN3413_c0_g1_i1.p1 TRINITY_DN3413_c0_g1~~TRINITY_DN3413_c0_g1_i1.p1  ORF type:complete len:611 (+),score=293.06 TRINITY_DN3413_c0_g1_i1:40-1833(+)